MNVFVRLGGGAAPIDLDVAPDDTVGALLDRAAPLLGVPEDVRASLQAEYAGAVLEEGMALCETGVDAGEEIVVDVPVDPAECIAKSSELDADGDCGDACVMVGRVHFPPSQGLQINMMPFVMAQTFEATGLPWTCRQYYERFFPEILDIPGIEAEVGKVCYLSIDERDVAASESHRRGGVHTETPGTAAVQALASRPSHKGHGHSTFNLTCPFQRPLGWHVAWGHSNGHLQGGIFMASNVADSCQTYNCKVMPHPATGVDIIGPYGDLSHVAHLLPGPNNPMLKNHLYWLTDRTPHESLPLATACHRQWFRLVTSDVSLWHRDHSTPNPNGVLPDLARTQVIVGNKFKASDLRVVPPEDVAAMLATEQ
eukprot:TRINITY_DN553_c0_g2_i11.p1 TRINITY_DN553_c0_g2~~TRINITY_DN553_c0_g2_i11.p1  ORF type:complete len:369 (+),score=85.95 TRINITY_DN553_c0_g2_i11:562-1668(+)